MKNNHPSRKNGVPFLLLGLFLILAGCMDFFILIPEMLLYSLNSLNAMTPFQNCIHWLLVTTTWGISIAFAFRLSSKYGFTITDNLQKPSRLKQILLFSLVIFGILFMSFTWEMQFKPLVEYRRFLQSGKLAGTAQFFFQYLYYLMESLLIFLLTAMGQRAGELFFPFKAAGRIPWGGLFCALTWGMLHGLTKDLQTAVLCIVLSALFGYSYLISNKNIYYAYPAIALIFLL